MKATRLLIALAVSALAVACSAAGPTAPAQPADPSYSSILIGSGNQSDTTKTTAP